MVSGSGEVILCAECPRQGSCSGTIVEARSRNVDSSYFGLRDRETGFRVPLKVNFVDAEGGISEYFAPYSEITDVANCTGTKEIAKSGFLRRQQIIECAAFIAGRDRFLRTFFPDQASPDE